MKIEIPNNELKNLIKEELLKLLKEFDFKLTLDLKNKEEPLEIPYISISKPKRIKLKTPKKTEINKKKRKILQILADSKKELSLPEINEKLGIPENNYSAKTRTRYILDLLKKEDKVKIKKVNKLGYIRNYYSLSENGTRN